MTLFLDTFSASAPAPPTAPCSTATSNSAAASNFKTSSSSNNLSDYYRIYKPSNGGLIITGGKTAAGPSGANFTRTGSFHNKPMSLMSTNGLPLSAKPDHFMRSFSFRRREPDEHHSSMPCLNANFSFKPYKPLSGAASNSGTPSSSTLVINSLAYQVVTVLCTKRRHGIL